MRALIEKCFDDHQKALEKSRALYPVIEDMAKICEKALRSGHKILICGNGGSAETRSTSLRNLSGDFITSAALFLPSLSRQIPRS